MPYHLAIALNFQDDEYDNIVVSNVLTFETTTSLLGEDYLSLAFKRKTDPSSVFLSRKFFSTPWGKIIPKNIIGERRFDVRFYLSEDALFMASISDKVKQIVKTGEDAVYYRRIRSESASRKKYNKYIILQNKLMLIPLTLPIFYYLFFRNSASFKGFFPFFPLGYGFQIEV